MQTTRNFRTTAEVAADYGVKAQSVIASLCRHGHYMGLRPQKLPNRFLAWPKQTTEAK